MVQAPHRGERKCGTCVLYTDIQDELKGGCQLTQCECAAKNVAAGKPENFGIAFCKNYKSPRFIDHSNHGDLGGPITGYCEWKCPPVMRKILYGEHQYRAVNADASWCHCWEPIKEVQEIRMDDPRLIRRIITLEPK